MAQNTLIRSQLTDILATAPSEKEWWDKRRTEIQSDFLKELDEESTTKEKGAGGDTSTVKSSDDDAVLVEGGGPAEKGKAKGGKKKGKQ